MLVCSKYRKSLENFGKMLIVLSESGMLMGCWGRRDVVAVLFFLLPQDYFSRFARVCKPRSAFEARVVSHGHSCRVARLLQCTCPARPLYFVLLCGGVAEAEPCTAQSDTTTVYINKNSGNLLE